MQVGIDLVALVIAIVTAIAYIVSNITTIKYLKESNKYHWSCIQDLQKKYNEEVVKKTEYNKLENELTTHSIQRSKDVLDFTNILGKFNITLTKLETTLLHVNETLSDIKSTIKTHDEEIKDLNGKIK